MKTKLHTITTYQIERAPRAIDGWEQLAPQVDTEIQAKILFEGELIKSDRTGQHYQVRLVRTDRTILQ
jgi:hypothetical protein